MILWIFASLLGSCNYLDVVPDNVATLENAFAMRSTAEQYLFTCYAYMPGHGEPYGQNPGFTAGDEIWFYQNISGRPAWQVAIGNQSVVDPYINYWTGERSGRGLYRAIRDCNIFLENIWSVPGMDDYEKVRWAAEAKFLKAYYHFWLLRQYGPIPLIRENLPISADVDEVKIARSPVDECVDYIVELLDEAAADLPTSIQLEIEELGRATMPMALAVKAKTLVMAASPLFNGNNDYIGYVNRDGTPLFDTEYKPEKWQRAALACKDAIDVSHTVGASLYYYSDGIYEVSNITTTEMNIRNAVTERWNSEIIWGNTNSRAESTLQRECVPRFYSTDQQISQTRSTFAPPIKMAELFYSKNGVPINEDVTYPYATRYSLRTATADERLFVREGYETVSLHFDREVRFYANLGFDGGRWYGQGRWNDSDNFYVEAKSGQVATGHVERYSATGYWPKKLFNPLNAITPNGVTYQPYPWPVIRLADLYLLYAEALNEVDGPGDQVYEWLNLVRERAGLPTVQDSWTNYSNNPGKYTNQSGLREIIHQERLIELAFEGHRLWDLRRWKKAADELNKPITGWDIHQPSADGYYRVRVLYDQSFSMRDYFWPIKEEELLVNKNLVQSPGW